MPQTEYEKALHTKKERVLRALYQVVFAKDPPLEFSKLDLIHSLKSNQQCTIDIKKKEDSKEEPVINTTKKIEKVCRKGSRRARIVEELTLGIWDHKTLSEALNIENPKWEIPQNQWAISTIVYELKKKGVPLSIKRLGEEKGRILLKC